MQTRTEPAGNDEHIVIITTATEYAVKVKGAATDDEAYKMASEQFDPNRHKRRDYTKSEIVFRPGG